MSSRGFLTRAQLVSLSGVLSLLLLVASCGGDDGTGEATTPPEPTTTTTTTEPTTTDLTTTTTPSEATTTAPTSTSDSAVQTSAPTSSSDSEVTRSLVPAEVVGIWETDLRDYYPDDDDICSPCGPEVTLTIGAEGTWRVQRAGGQASGGLSLDDGHLVFGPSTVCPGIGTYEWRSDGDTLTLTAVEPDDCVRRQEALDGPTYVRQE